ncbi:MAG: hypothetical protein H0S84_01285 [Bacteroidales bacterium]|jgi:hypothetical protein|nr:hypothetical protein [Bacteroidales bacterium]
MKYKAINQLIEKYFEGLTTLEEEALLREYFEQEEIPEEWQSIRPLFRLKQDVSLADKPFEEAFDRHLANQKSEINKIFQWPLVAAVAAVAILFFSLFDFNEPSSTKDTFNDPAEAYAEVIRTLQFMGIKLFDGMSPTIMAGNKLDKGIAQIERLRWIDIGIEKTRQLGEIDQTRNLLKFNDKP